MGRCRRADERGSAVGALWQAIDIRRRLRPAATVGVTARRLGEVALDRTLSCVKVMRPQIVQPSYSAGSRLVLRDCDRYSN